MILIWFDLKIKRVIFVCDLISPIKSAKTFCLICMLENSKAGIFWHFFLNGIQKPKWGNRGRRLWFFGSPGRPGTGPYPDRPKGGSAGFSYFIYEQNVSTWFGSRREASKFFTLSIGGPLAVGGRVKAFGRGRGSHHDIRSWRRGEGVAKAVFRLWISVKFFKMLKLIYSILV